MNEDEMQDPEIEVNIVDDGSMLPDEDEGTPDPEMEFDLAELMGVPMIEEDTPEEQDFFRNLAEDLDEGTLSTIATDLLSLFEEDDSARKDWLQGYVDGLELLGLKIEKRTEPWAGACGVYNPLLSEAIVKFQAETMMSTFPPAGPVKTKILGKETPVKQQAATNVQNDMNFELLEVMTEYRAEHERMLWGMAVNGNGFKKVYFDPSLGRQVSIYVPAEDFVVPYGAANIESAERATHILRKTKNEIRKLQVSGFYRDTDLGDPQKGELDEVEKKIAENMGFNATSDDRFKILEMQVDLDLSEYNIRDSETEDDGVAVPYIITLEKTTSTVLSIYRNWAPEDEHKNKRDHFVHYPLIPGFGFYAFGYVHLLGAFAKSATSITRQLVDAGTLSNLPGGFKTRGMRIKGDDTPISPGEFRDVDVASGNIKENIMTLPYKEPSQTLFQLLGAIVEEGRKFANTTELNASDMSAQAPVGTTLAILERSLKVMSAVQARVHYAMKKELKLLAAIIRDHAPDEYAYEPEKGTRAAKKADYDVVEVIPVSDPNASTMAQKVTQYQAVMQMAQQSPEIYDMPELHKQMLEVLGIKNIDKLIPAKAEVKPTDPVTENMRLLNQTPVKAFQYQDHKAHIAVHMSMAQDPQIGQLLKNNPDGQKIAAAGMAHINEHLAFQYRKDIEDQLGFALPPLDAALPQQLETQVSQLVAQAATQMTQQKQAQAAQQQQQAEAQDPLNIIQKMQLELQQQELQMKAQIEQAKLQNQAQLEQAKLQHQIQVDQAKVEIEKTKLMLQAGQMDNQQQIKEKELEVKQYIEGTKMGLDIAKGRTDREYQATTRVQDRAHQAAQAARGNQSKQPPTRGEKGNQ